MKLFTRSGMELAIGYRRVVIGERGPYLEIEHNQIWSSHLRIPPGQGFRLYSNLVYYVEYRSTDPSNVKVYFQKREVEYADYKKDMYYVSPFDLVDQYGKDLIEPLRKEPPLEQVGLQQLALL